MCQPYIESATALSDVDDEEPQEFQVFVSRRHHMSQPYIEGTTTLSEMCTKKICFYLQLFYLQSE